MRIWVFFFFWMAAHLLRLLPAFWPSVHVQAVNCRLFQTRSAAIAALSRLSRPEMSFAWCRCQRPARAGTRLLMNSVPCRDQSQSQRSGSSGGWFQSAVVKEWVCHMGMAVWTVMRPKTENQFQLKKKTSGPLTTALSWDVFQNSTCEIPTRVIFSHLTLTTQSRRS